MNKWLIAATALLFCFIPCGIACIRAHVMNRIAALELATIITVLVLLLLAMGFHRPAFFDLALTLALLSYPSSLLFVHYLERWK